MQQQASASRRRRKIIKIEITLPEDFATHGNSRNTAKTTQSA
jgi:hypothetical protein